jgi:hypothetical protein
MRRIQATIRECSNCRSIIWLAGGLEMPDMEADEEVEMQRRSVRVPPFADDRGDLFVT